ncbi:class I SAM-dependent methyltransferase [Nannocystis sp.]|uniref:class I SAM-dependent methyltransferase n=1 Tax=Nannocystis sp. TaxID=1962667 RepID=UPI0025CC0102|nr:class I SAM-dependent methyltransferase [Nannocystis sp.]MBK7824006.1 class I SAM-dependent methyltransferase [Nannocystis sp.]
MTWHVSPEEWLLDFTSVPRGRARGDDSLDAIDDRLRSMLTVLPAAIVLPSITGRARPAAAPPRPEREPSRPVPEARSTAGSGPRDAAPEAARERSVLEVEIVSLLQTPIDEEPPVTPTPPVVADAMVIPSLTRPNFDIDEDDAAEALDRISPERSSPQLGIPEDDADDMMSAMAAGSQVLNPQPPAEDEPEDELDADALEYAENSGLIVMPTVPADDPEDLREPPPVEKLAILEPEKPIDRAPPAVAEKAPPPPPPVAEKVAPPPPPPLPPPPPFGERGPDKPTPPPPPEKAGPPRPPEKPNVPPPPTKPPPPVSKVPPLAAAVAAAAAAAPATAGGRKHGWHDDAFGDHFASIQPIDADQSAELDAVFIRKSAELGAGQTVLDVACGDGRHCFALANLGLMVTGLDSSLSQLVRASQRNEATEAGVTLLHGDMRALPRDRSYDVVTCLGSSFGYFEGDAQNRQVLQEMVEVLRPGGKLVLHVFNRDYLVAVMPCRSWWQGRGCLVLDVADMNYFTNRMRIHRTVVFEDGRQFEHHMYFRAYSLHELGKLLTSFGMRVLEVSGSRDTRGRFYGATSAEIWIVAQRREDI